MYIQKANYALKRWRAKEVEWQVKVCLSFNTSYYCSSFPQKFLDDYCTTCFVFCLTLQFLATGKIDIYSIRSRINVLHIFFYFANSYYISQLKNCYTKNSTKSKCFLIKTDTQNLIVFFLLKSEKNHNCPFHCNQFFFNNCYVSQVDYQSIIKRVSNQKSLSWNAMRF